MLIQHLSKLPSKSNLVNKTLIGLIMAGSAIALPAAASASNYSGTIKTSVHKVKFKTADLKTKDGLAAVYAMLETKADKACADGSNVDFNGNRISKEACAKNLLAQFVTSSDMMPLKQYHSMKTAETKTASLLPY